MDSKIIKIFFFIFLTSINVDAVEFDGKFRQGHFIIGKTKNEKVTILSPDFLFIGCEEKTLEKCLESETFQTWKQSEKTRRVNLVRGEFLDYLKNNYTSQAQEVKTKFKIS